MGYCDDGQPVIELDIAITATKRDAQSRHATVDTFMITPKQCLPIFIAEATYFQLELLRNSFANK